MKHTGGVSPKVDIGQEMRAEGIGVTRHSHTLNTPHPETSQLLQSGTLISPVCVCHMTQTSTSQMLRRHTLAGNEERCNLLLASPSCLPISSDTTLASKEGLLHGLDPCRLSGETLGDKGGRKKAQSANFKTNQINHHFINHNIIMWWQNAHLNYNFF